ncbi:hypothetical protein QBC34DRAFT_309909 [Podospora aff. communis PSN243]|uniref:Uncharacterized protein n=1 Tax=Podospora aff. communis PSN243 TaxID=3040156 RepID=A0AAV9G855_9PEZI|nr:hypothetical protein QBC34DRAFT_309909 [Podospora aff. communis PSN243]
MSSNAGAAYNVYVGAWTDWSRGKVLGATLTLTRQDSGVLIAFLAFFVALVGTRFWRIICLLLHWSFSKDSPADGVHHQRQAFLRNSPNPESAFWTLAGMAVYWRRNAPQVWARVASLLGLALACLVGFVLAGGYSSRITTLVTSEVLLSGANCGFVGDAGVNISNYGRTIGPMIAQAMIAAESYARQCYDSASIVGSPSCSTSYVRRQLPTAIVDTNASCPFDSKVCKSSTGNLFIDTGFIDSYHDLGRNTPPNQRMQFRRTLHCAPLATHGYRFETYDGSDHQPQITYYYGSLLDANDTASINYTTRYSADNAMLPIEDLTQNFFPDTERDFGIRSHAALFYKQKPYPGLSTFVPIPELAPQNASGTVWIQFLKSDNILFTEQTNDGWYGQDLDPVQVHKLKIMESGNVTMFRQRLPGSPLACQEMDQICFTGVKGVRKCGRLGSLPDTMQDVDAMLDDGDKEWYAWFTITTFETVTQVRDAVELLGTRALRARDSLNGPILGSLPNSQWQLEVQHWHAASAAHLQDTFLRSIIGPTNPELPKLVEVWYPNTTVEREICASQKVVVEGFVSFSILAIICIFLGGGLIILLSFTLDTIMSWCLGRIGRQRTQYSRLEWSTNETLQIQRLAHEATGAGTWSRTTGAIPVTKPGDMLAVLDIADPEHPRLRAPVTGVDHGSEGDDTSETASPGDNDEKNVFRMDGTLQIMEVKGKEEV